MNDDRTPKRYCGAPTRSGGTCRHSTNLSEANGRCLVHDPERTEQWRAATRRGQQQSVAARAENRRRDMALLEDKLPRPPAGDTLPELVTFMTWCIEACARGELDQGMARTITAAIRVQESAIAKRDLERRVADFEKLVKRLKTENQRLRAAAK